MKKKNKTNKLNIKQQVKRRQIEKNILILKKTEGIYNSYWLGKFLNMFIRKGKKQLAFKNLHIALLLIKLSNNKLPILYIFEILERIKPTFILTNLFLKRKLIIYPRLVKPVKKYNLVLKWVRELFIAEYNAARKTGIIYSKAIYTILEYLSNTRRHPLIKRRDNYHIEIVRLQDNIRYTWSK